MHLIEKGKYRDEYLLTISELMQASTQIREAIIEWMPNKNGYYLVEVGYHQMETRRDNVRFYTFKVGSVEYNYFVSKGVPIDVLEAHKISLNELKMALLLTE